METKSLEARLDQIEALLRSQVLFNKSSLSLEEASVYTGYSKSALYKYHANGIIPASKPGGKSLRFQRKDLDAFLAGDDFGPTFNSRNHG